MDNSKYFGQRKINLVKLNDSTWRKSFYRKPDAIERKNIQLRKNRSKLNLIKDSSIKDMIYSHKNVPISWRRKANYQDQVMSLISNDEKFLAYLGNIGGNLNLSKIEHKSSNENNKTGSYENQNIKNKMHLFRNKSMDERELDIYLTKLGKNYPIKGKLNELFDEKTLKSIESKNKLIAINKSELTYKLITSEKKKKDINKNIYLHLISDKSRNSKNPKYNRAQSALIKSKQKYIDKDIYNRNKINIKDRYALNQLASINYYGPYFSYCPECGKRNKKFYQNINVDVLIGLVNQIKKNKNELNLRNSNIKQHILKEIY